MNTNTIVVVTALIVTFTAGFLVGNMTGGSSNPAQQVADSVQAGMEKTSETFSGNSSDTNAGSSGNEVAFTVSIDDLSDSQKSMLRTMGIDSNEIQVTNNMLVCAEAEVGSQRMTEIRNGASPSMSEGIALVGCYSAG